MSAIGAGWLYVGWGAVLFETYYGLMQHTPFEIKERLLKALDKEYNVVDMAAVLEIVTILERTPITKEALETTRLGRDINELRRKTRNESLAKRTKDLVRRWRDLILPQNDAPPSETTTHQNGASRPAVVPVRTVRTHPPISPATSLPNSDKSSISPALSTRVEAVPRTHAANKRLRKEINPPISKEVKRANESSPELPSKRVKSETQQPLETQDIKPRLNGDHYDSVSSDCEIGNFKSTLPKQKSRKKAPKDRTQKESTSDDIVKEKIALIARVPKVKTTQELLAGLQSRSNDAPDNCGLPVVDHDIVKNKTEHIARFLRSQADNLEEIDEGRSSPPESDNHSITESDLDIHHLQQHPEISKELLSEHTVDEILSRLPPLDIEKIKWDETPIPSPEENEVTNEDVNRVLNEHIEGVNGNYDESGDVRVFREWHEVVSRTSYNSELIHVLPYVVID